MRPIKDNEKVIISKFAEKLDEPGRGQLLTDVANATAQDVVPDASRIMFDIVGYERPPYRGQHSFGVDGRILDEDATELTVCLYADENGRLLELEFIRWDAGDLLNPQWETFEVL